MAATTLNIPSPHSVADGVEHSANLLGKACAASLVSEILTTEEFAAKIRASRETVQAWKKNNILINGRHYLGNGTHVTFPWPLCYVLMMADKIELDQETNQQSTEKHPVTVKKAPNKTPKRPSKSDSRIGTDF